MLVLALTSCPISGCVMTLRGTRLQKPITVSEKRVVLSERSKWRGFPCGVGFSASPISEVTMHTPLCIRHSSFVIRHFAREERFAGIDAEPGQGADEPDARQNGDDDRPALGGRS